MDASKSDVDFDSYWDEEARNPNRNRIRIGRQYQAQVPPLLKSGESDGRKLEELETLTWNPHNPLTNCQLDQYFAIAKSVGLFVQAIDTCQDGIEDNECLYEEKCNLPPFEIPNIGTKSTLDTGSGRIGKVEDHLKPSSSSSSASVTPEKQSITTRQRLQQQKSSPSKEELETNSSLSPLKSTSNQRIQNALKGLSTFLTAHHPTQREKRCKFSPAINSEPGTINLGCSEKYSLQTLSRLLTGEWSNNEAKVFAQALQSCGKNFSAIKKDYLPWKSVRSIIEFYYATLDKENDRSKQQQKKKQTKVEAKAGKTDDKKKGSKDDTSDSAATASEDNEPAPSSSKENDAGSSGDGNAIDSKNDNSSGKSYSNDEDEQQQERDDLATRPIALVKPTQNHQSVNSEATNEVAAPKVNGKSNMNKTPTYPPFLEFTQLGLLLPGEEVKPLKGKPISSQNGSASCNHPNGPDAGNTSLGSLNLYLHGELVLRLNAQQQESGQKWVESMEAMPPSGRRKHHATNANGLTRISGYKRPQEKTVPSSVPFKEEPDDNSIVGSGSDDDSMTSNESSSLVASSPSSSSTITSAVKKARVKVENLNSLGLSNGHAAMPSPTANGRKLDQVTSNGKSSSPQHSDTELEIKRKLLEYYQMSPQELQNFLATTMLSADSHPPKAHSNPSVVPTSKSGKTAEQVGNNGFINGFGPVDLTRRKSPSSHQSSELVQCSPRQKHHPLGSMSRLGESSLLSPPSGAHRAHSQHSSFSLPAPPPLAPNVPLSPNGGAKTLKKALFR